MVGGTCRGRWAGWHVPDTISRGMHHGSTLWQAALSQSMTRGVKSAWHVPPSSATLHNCIHLFGKFIQLHPAYDLNPYYVMIVVWPR